MTDSNLAEPDVRPAPVVPDPVAFGADLVLAGLFVLVGETSHAEGHVLARWPVAAWPFLTGALVGWAALLLTRRVGRRLPGGSFLGAVVVVAASIVIGMTLRSTVMNDPAPVSFLIAATTFLSLFLFGWRAVARFVLSRRA